MVTKQNSKKREQISCLCYSSHDNEITAIISPKELKRDNSHWILLSLYKYNSFRRLFSMTLHSYKMKFSEFLNIADFIVLILLWT